MIGRDYKDTVISSDDISDVVISRANENILRDGIDLACKIIS